MKTKKILVFRNDRFGEFLLNLPAFRALKENYSEAKILLVVNPYLEELAKSIDFIDEVITWDSKKHNLFEVISFSFQLAIRKIDLCVVFNPSKESNLISFLAGIPVRVGYDRKWGALLTHRIEDKKHLALKHEVEYNLDLVNVIGVKTENKNIALNTKQEYISSLFSTFKINNSFVLLAVHPWTSDPIKQWPLKNFKELVKRLAQKDNIKIVIIGGKEESGRSGEFSKISPERIINFTGKTSLVQLAALLKYCKLLVSADSGPMHLAAGVGTAVIALFRNDILGKGPVRWGPWGQGHIVLEKNDLSLISVNEVLDEINIKLNKYKLN